MTNQATNTDNQEQSNQSEINISELISFFLSYKVKMLKVIVICAILGVVIALFSKDEFTASTSFIPQFSDGQGSASGLSGLASIAGINLSGGASDNNIAPSVYPKIVSSVNFRLELSRAKIVLNVGGQDSISYSEYYSDYYKPSRLSGISKYTIGLPSLIISSLRSKPENDSGQNSEYNFLKLSMDEDEDVQRIMSQLVVQHNERSGYVSLFFNMDNPYLAAQMTEHAKNLLQDQLITFKIKNAQLQLSFIEARLEEKRTEFVEAELKLAQFLDANQSLSSQLAQNRQRQLESEYNLKLGVYTELTKQIEQAKIQVAKDTPVFSIIDPVSIPSKKTKPKRAQMVILFVVVGAFLMMIYILAKFVLKQNAFQFLKSS